MKQHRAFLMEVFKKAILEMEDTYEDTYGEMQVAPVQFKFDLRVEMADKTDIVCIPRGVFGRTMPVPETITESEASYLVSVETVPFAPIGWLYESIFNDLTKKNLVRLTQGSYLITDLGKKQLKAFRAARRTSRFDRMDPFDP